MEEELPSKARYWQLPVFILGIAALAAAYYKFPNNRPSEQVLTNLKEINMVLDANQQTSPKNWSHVEVQVRQIELKLKHNEPSNSQVALAVGSWHVLEAEYGTPKNKSEHWETATKFFSQVNPNDLSPEELEKFNFRNSKVQAINDQGNPNELLAKLNNPPSPNEDIGYRGLYVYKSAMRCEPKDNLKAKAGLDEFLKGPSASKISPTEKSRYSLELGRMLLQEGDTENAKLWLKNLEVNAEPEVKLNALLHLATIEEQQKNFIEASSRYTQAMKIKVSDAENNRVRFLSGEAFMRMNKTQEAMKTYTELMALDNTQYGLVSSLRLAEMNARMEGLTNRKQNVDQLERAYKGLKPTGQMDNTLYTLDDLRNVSELTIRACIRDNDEINAKRALTLFEKISSPSRAAEVKADGLQALAYETARQSDPSNRSGELHKSAAAEFQRIAATATSPSDKANALLKAADSLMAANDPAAAKLLLVDAMNTAGVTGDKMASVRLSLAKVTKEPEQKKNFYQQVIDQGGIEALSAKVGLAEVIDKQAEELSKNPKTVEEAKTKYEEAVKILEQVAYTTSVSPIDLQPHERSMFLLGQIKCNLRNYSEAESILRLMLERYPNAREADNAKMRLGVALLQIGKEQNKAEKVEEAITILEPLLKSSNNFIRGQSGLFLANSYLVMQNHEKVLSASIETANMDNVRNTVTELTALSMAYNANISLKRVDQAKQVEARIRKLIRDLPDEQFNNSTLENTRSYWKDNWLKYFDSQNK